MCVTFVRICINILISYAWDNDLHLSPPLEPRGVLKNDGLGGVHHGLGR